MSGTIDRGTFLARGGMLVVAFAWPDVVSAQQQQSAPGSGQREAQTQGTPQYPDVQSWLAIERDGTVTIFFGKAELGTGVKTAVAQLVSDDLDVPFSSVRVIAPDTSRTPNQGYTAGSQTLTAGATPVRQAAATARLALLELAAAQLNVPIDRLETRSGNVVVSGETSRALPYGTLLAGKRIDRAIDRHAPLAVSAQRTIGKPVARVDLPGKVVGTFRYVHDLRVPGMLHGRVILPPRVGAKLVRVDEASLHALPERVRVVRKGNFLGVVAAKEWHAMRAAQMLAVQWSGGDTLPAMSALAETVRRIPGTPRVVAQAGDVETALRGGRNVRASYSWPFQSHGSIGPSCAIADVRPSGTTVWSATQGVYPLRGAIAGLLGVPDSSVRVTYIEGAGCYGHNGADDASAAAALLSQAVGAPVRVQYSRADETRWDPKGPAMVMDLAGAIDGSGKIAAWEYAVRTPSHSGRPDGKASRMLPAVLDGASFGNATGYVGGDRNAKTNYTLSVQRVTVYDQPTSLIRYSALRGLGGTANTFANESFVDELAHLAAANPLDFRLAHLGDERARAVLEALRKNYRQGRGVAFVRYENTGAYVGALADVSVDRSSGAVRVNEVWIAHDCGLIVNPDGLRNQIEGNVVQAASRALFEEVHFGPDGVTSVDWQTYPILRFRDLPEVSVELLDRPNDPILGAGEATTTVVAPAIGNAIFAQTGARLRTVPFTPERVGAALRAAS